LNSNWPRCPRRTVPLRIGPRTGRYRYAPR
jgi:hypothetical protein